MLSRDRVDLVELKEICDDIVADDNRAAEVIRRLGALYRRGDMKMESFDLNELIRETLDLLRAELLIRHVTPRIDLAPAVPSVDGGRVQLQQVVLNLVVNAADAMTEVDVARRTLEVRTEATNTDVRLHVVDNGHGIPEGDLKKSVRSVLQHEVRGHGHRARDLPVDRRGAPGQHHGDQQLRRRNDVFRQPAGEGKGVTDAAAAAAIFLVDDDPGVLRGAVAGPAGGRLERRDVRVRGSVPRAAGAEGGRLPRTRCDDAGAGRPRSATPARGRRRVVADRVHQRPWRHSHVGARHQGGRNRFPDQAGRGGGAGRSRARRDRTACCDAQRDGRRPRTFADVSRVSPRASATSWRHWRRESSTSRSPPTWALSSRRSSSTGRASWIGCRQEPARS